MKKLLLLAILLTGCAHTPVTDPTGPGGFIAAEDSTGFYFNQEGYDQFLRQGVPATYFRTAEVNGTHHITDPMLHAANVIRLNRANPALPPK